MRLFISGATDEFLAWRVEAAGRINGSLRELGVQALTQESLPLSGYKTLSKLDDEIRASAAVVHLIGSELGSPTSKEARLALDQRYGHRDDYTQLCARIKSNHPSEPTYTQWEAYLAHFLRRPLFIVRASANARDATAAEAAKAAAHLSVLKALGNYEFAKVTLSTAGMLADFVLASARGLPTVGLEPPYHEAGNDGLDNLLNPRTQLLPFINRQKEEDDPAHLLKAWAANSGSAARGCLLTGAGGAGKTRLAAEVADRLAKNRFAPHDDFSCHWHSGFLPPDMVSIQDYVGSHLQTLIKRTDRRSLFVVADDAEGRLPVLDAVARDMRANQNTMRLVLISRGEAAWIEPELRKGFPDLAAICAKHKNTRKPQLFDVMPLTSGERSIFFHNAVDAARNIKALIQEPVVRPAIERPPTDELIDAVLAPESRFDRPLCLALLAFMQVHNSSEVDDFDEGLFLEFALTVERSSWAAALGHLDVVANRKLEIAAIKVALVQGVQDQASATSLLNDNGTYDRLYMIFASANGGVRALAPQILAEHLVASDGRLNPSELFKECREWASGDTTKQLKILQSINGASDDVHGMSDDNPVRVFVDQLVANMFKPKDLGYEDVDALVCDLLEAATRSRGLLSERLQAAFGVTGDPFYSFRRMSTLVKNPRHTGESREALLTFSDVCAQARVGRAALEESATSTAVTFAKMARFLFDPAP